MSMQMNQVNLIGNLGSTPELRRTQSGTAVTNMSVATTRYFRTANGDKHEETTWIRITVFGRQAESCCEYLEKGNLVRVAGRISNREWTDKNGIKRYANEVVANRVDFGP